MASDFIPVHELQLFIEGTTAGTVDLPVNKILGISEGNTPVVVSFPLIENRGWMTNRVTGHNPQVTLTFRDYNELTAPDSGPAASARDTGWDKLISIGRMTGQANSIDCELRIRSSGLIYEKFNATVVLNTLSGIAGGATGTEIGTNTVELRVNGAVTFA